MSRPAVKMDKPHMHPYICGRCLCGVQANREYFIDTGITYDYEGNVYLCNMCLKDMAKAAGEFFTKDEVDLLLSVQSEAIGSASQLKKDWDNLVVYAKEHGINLEFLREQSKEENDVRGISTEDNRESTGTNKQPISLSRILGD